MRNNNLNIKSRYKLLLVVLLMTLTAFTGCGSSTDVHTDGSSAVVEDADSAKLEQLAQDKAAGMLILVNKENPVEQDYVPEDLAPVKYYAEDRSPSCRYMRTEAADHFHELVEAARADGVDIVMTTAYRSYDFQTILWDNNVAAKGSEEEANKTSARPGQSEHQTGLAVDLSTSEINYELSYDFGDTEAGRWVAENAHKYGFILRYLEGKTDITGYSFEPWHIRYVGTTAATDIWEQNITLEEYLEQLEF